MRQCSKAPRLIVMLAAAFAVSFVPVARAFAKAAAVRPGAFECVSIHRGESAAGLAHHFLRRPRQSAVAALSSEAPQSAFFAARRTVPVGKRFARAASFASLLDHPPA